jgi:hypothetical protein
MMYIEKVRRICCELPPVFHSRRTCTSASLLKHAFGNIPPASLGTHCLLILRFVWAFVTVNVDADNMAGQRSCAHRDIHMLSHVVGREFDHGENGDSEAAEEAEELYVCVAREGVSPAALRAI